MLAYCFITSPVDGRVGLRQVDPGNLIHATDTTGIVTITQIHPISATFTLPQEELPRVQTGHGQRRSRRCWPMPATITPSWARERC